MRLRRSDIIDAAVMAAVVALASSVGCGPRRVDPPGIWFGGQPVDHWLEQAASADASRRCRAVDTLADIGPRDARAIPAVIAALDDAEPSVRIAAVAGLSRLGPAAADAVPALGRLQQDPDADVRARATIALQQIISPRSRRNP